MTRTLCWGVFMLLIGSSLAAQTPVPWEVRGDTTGAPHGCGAMAGIRALDHPPGADRAEIDME